MDDELKSLEDKIDLLIRLYQETREENVRLYRLLENAEVVNCQHCRTNANCSRTFQDFTEQSAGGLK